MTKYRGDRPVRETKRERETGVAHTETIGAQVDTEKALAALLDGADLDRIEMQVRALRAARAEKKAADDAASTQGKATFAAMAAILPKNKDGNWQLDVDLPRVGTQVVATAFESEPRTIDLEKLAGLVSEETLARVTDQKANLTKFDAAVKLGLISSKIVKLVVSTTTTQTVKLTETAVKAK